MSNLGAIKLRQWRRRGQAAETIGPDAGRSARTIAQEEVGDLAGVSKVMISLLERGERQPSLRLALRLQELGVCETADWSRPPRCGACNRVLTHPPMTPPCMVEACPYADLFEMLEDAA